MHAIFLNSNFIGIPIIFESDEYFIFQEGKKSFLHFIFI